MNSFLDIRMTPGWLQIEPPTSAMAIIGRPSLGPLDLMNDEADWLNRLVTEVGKELPQQQSMGTTIVHVQNALDYAIDHWIREDRLRGNFPVLKVKGSAVEPNKIDIVMRARFVTILEEALIHA